MNRHFDLPPSLALGINNRSFSQVDALPGERNHIAESRSDVVTDENRRLPFRRRRSQQRLYVARREHIAFVALRPRQINGLGRIMKDKRMASGSIEHATNQFEVEFYRGGRNPLLRSNVPEMFDARRRQRDNRLVRLGTK